MDAARLGQVRTMSCPVPAAPSENLGLIVFEPDPRAYEGKCSFAAPGETALPTAGLGPAWALPSPGGLAAKLGALAVPRGSAPQSSSSEGFLRVPLLQPPCVGGEKGGPW